MKVWGGRLGDVRTEGAMGKNKSQCFLENREGKRSAYGCPARQRDQPVWSISQPSCLGPRGLRTVVPMPYPMGLGFWVRTSTFVRRPRGQGTPIEALLTVLTVGPCCVVQTAQAVARVRITVAHSIKIHVPAAPAPAAGPGSSRES